MHRVYNLHVSCDNGLENDKRVSPPSLVLIDSSDNYKPFEIHGTWEELDAFADLIKKVIAKDRHYDETGEEIDEAPV